MAGRKTIFCGDIGCYTLGNAQPLDMSTKRDLDSQTILNAAVELAEERGLENISLLQIAEKLGVKPPSLYNHLSGLQEISSGIAKLAISRLGDSIRNAAVGRSKGDALSAIASAYRKFAKENPELYKAILRFHEESVLQRNQLRRLFSVLPLYGNQKPSIIFYTNCIDIHIGLRRDRVDSCIQICAQNIQNKIIEFH